MYQSSKKEKYILKDVDQIRKRLNQNPSGQTILPNFTPFTYAEKSQINKFRIGLEALKLPCDLHTAKEDFFYFYRQISNDSQSFNALSEKSNQLLSARGFDDPRYRNIFDIYCSVGIAYRVINNTLRLTYESSVTSYLRFPFHFLYNGIKEGYWKDEPKDKQLILWRGGKMNQQQLKKISRCVGGFIEVEGFMSTSSLLEVVGNFCDNVLFKVIVPVRERTQEGNHGYLNLKKFSDWAEKQYLFNTLNIFKILSVQETEEDFGGGNKRKVQLIVLQYGSLPECLSKKQKNKPLKKEEEDLIINYENLKYIFSKIKHQGIALFQLYQLRMAEQYFKEKLQFLYSQRDIQNQEEENIKQVIQCHRYLIKIYAKESKIEENKSEIEMIDKILNLRKDLDLSDEKLFLEYEKCKLQFLIYETYKNETNSVSMVKNIKQTANFFEFEKTSNEKADCYLELNKILTQFYLKYDVNTEQSHCYIKKAQEFIEENYKENKVLRAKVHYNFGRMLVLEKQYEQAIKSLNKSNEIYDVLLGDYHEEKSHVLNALCVAHCQNKNYPQALEYIIKRENIMKQLYVSNRENRMTKQNKAYINLKMKNSKEALKLFLEIKESYIDKETQQINNTFKSSIYIFLGKSYLLENKINQMKEMRKVGQECFNKAEQKDGVFYRSILEQLEEIRKIQ